MEPDKERIENERLRFALEAAGIGMWDLDPIRGIVEWNERCRELFGFAEGQVVPYEQVLQYMHPDDAAAVHAAVEKALSPDTDSSYEVRYRTINPEDGSTRWVLSKGKAYFNEQGVAWRFAGTAQDVTSLIADSEKKTVIEKMAQLALENSNSGYFHLSLISNKLEYSPGYAHIITGEETAGLTRADFLNRFHPEDRHIRDAAHAEALITGKLDYEVRTIWTDGSIHWLRAMGSYLNDVTGTPYVLTGTVYDTTAEHQQLEAVKQAEDLLAAAFDNASVGMAFTDLEGKYLKVNEAYANMHGYETEQMYALRFPDLVQPEQHAENQLLFTNIVTGTQQYYNLALQTTHITEECRWLLINATRITGSADKAGRILIIASDISAEIEKEKELAVAQSMFRNVTNSAPTGLWLSDEQGMLTYLNKTLVEWTGMAYADLLGTGWASAIIDEDRQYSAETFLAAVASRTHYDVQFRLRKGDGSIVWCQAAGDPFYTDDGSYAGYAGFCIDIDELVASRLEIAANEWRFRSMVEQAPMAISLLTGRDMVIEVGNDKVFEMWHKDKSITGMRIADALPEIKDGTFMQQLQSVYDTGEPVSGTGMLSRLPVNGTENEAYFDYVYTPLRTGNGKVSGVIVLATEVTATVIARKRLEESELYARSVFYNSPVAKMCSQVLK